MFSACACRRRLRTHIPGAFSADGPAPALTLHHKGAHPFRGVGDGTRHSGLGVLSIVPLLVLLLHWDYTFSAHVQTEVQDLTTAIRRGTE